MKNARLVRNTGQILPIGAWGTVIQYHSGSIFATLNSRRTKTSIIINRLV